MKNRTYTIIGALKFKPTRRGAAGLTVQAWDKDLLFDDALGSAVTDAEGGFRITFTEARFRDLFGERRPDLYFRVSDQAGNLVASTEDSVRWNLAAGETPVEIVVDLPDTAPPAEPTPVAERVVRGRIQQADATPLAGALVRAFDKDLREEQLLGEQTTDAEGRYAIRYGRHQFRRAEQQQVDLIVRVLDGGGGLLAASPVIFDAAAETTVDLVVGGGALREASEFEQLLAALAPALDRAEPARLGRLTRDSLPLVAAIRARRDQGEVRTLRDLARLGIDDWQTLIREAGRGRARLPIPDAIPGDDDEVRLANYARVIRSELEAAFPTDFIAAVMEETPELDLALVRRVLERYPDIDPTKPLTAALDPELAPEEEDRVAATMASLRRELKLYPETPYRDLLQTGDAWSNPLRVALARFFANAPDFDFEHHRVAAYLADNGDKAFAGIAEPHRPAVTAQLRRLQRLFQVTPRAAQVHALLAEGLDSAYRIAAVPQQTFRTRMAAQLGGELETHAVYRNALRIVAGTLSLSGTHPPST